jgi:hypothetical protein
VGGKSQVAADIQSLSGDFGSLIHWMFAAKVLSGKIGQKRWSLGWEMEGEEPGVETKRRREVL